MPTNKNKWIRHHSIQNRQSRRRWQAIFPASCSTQLSTSLRRKKCIHSDAKARTLTALPSRQHTLTETTGEKHPYWISNKHPNNFFDIFSDRKARCSTVVILLYIHFDVADVPHRTDPDIRADNKCQQRPSRACTADSRTRSQRCPSPFSIL